ncbi:hypothetical protein MKK52_17300, partial [Methylobacterium sp. J-067]|nr:hypothetical protein [Methylobacterium sp. J-067]
MSLNPAGHPVITGLLAAHGFVLSYARSRTLPLTLPTRSSRGGTFAVSHKFARAAIMTVATLAAREHQKRNGGTWGAAMAVCLKAAWQTETAAPSLRDRAADLSARLAGTSRRPEPAATAEGTFAPAPAALADACRWAVQHRAWVD